MESFGLYVKEAENSRSEFRLEIKILLCKSTSRTTKVTFKIINQKVLFVKFQMLNQIGNETDDPD